MKAIKDKIKKFPDRPGVYRFISENKTILYIGRATSLKKRVGQYFRGDLDPRIAEMVSLAKNVKFFQTDSVLDAVILEANLIKKYWPKYNVKDKDNRSFVYAVIPQKDYAYPLIVRERELVKLPRGRNKIFGPYQSATLLKNALKILRRVFPYGTCLPRPSSGAGLPNSGKACFDYQIGLCPGSCIGQISANDYQKNINAIAAILSGRKKNLLKNLAKDNPEKASTLKHLHDVVLITADELGLKTVPNRLEGYDISHLSGRETYGAMAVFTGGAPDKNEYRLFKIKEAPAGDDLKALAEMVIRRFGHPEWPWPDFVLIDGGVPQVTQMAKLFKYLNIAIPFAGISKYGGDRLVFPKGTKPNIRKLAESIKPILLRVRDEAHRFGRGASRRARKVGRK